MLVENLWSQEITAELTGFNLYLWFVFESQPLPCVISSWFVLWLFFLLLLLIKYLPFFYLLQENYIYQCKAFPIIEFIQNSLAAFIQYRITEFIQNLNHFKFFSLSGVYINSKCNKTLPMMISSTVNIFWILTRVHIYIAIIFNNLILQIWTLKTY